MQIGIYKIINIINGNFYIGSSNMLSKRKWTHFRALLLNKHDNVYLQRAYNKYGNENFLFEVMELCEIDELLSKEQYYLDNLKPQYNMNFVANKPPSPKGKKQTQEQILKRTIQYTGIALTEAHKQSLRKPKSDQGKINMSKGQTGKKYSEEAKINRSNKMKGVKRALGYKHTEEQRIAGAKSRMIPIYQIDKEDNILKEWESASTAASELQLGKNARTNIGMAVRGVRKTAYGFKWKEKNK